MKVAFIIYQEMTTLDFVGVYDPITRLRSMGFMPDLQWDICAYSQQVSDNKGIDLIPNKVGESLQNYHMAIVPGGVNVKKLIDNAEFIAWIKTIETCKFKISVCTGSLLLGAAGFLEGKKATTHPDSFSDLQNYCLEVLDERIVDEGEVITARGVTSSIDLGLYLCEKFAGAEAKEKIRQVMDYPYGI